LAIRTIRKEDDLILRKTSKHVKEITPNIINLLDDMVETMRSMDGVGLAAPQVGALKRVIVVEHEEDLYELINPVITTQEGEQISNEACLSAPGRCGDIKRPFQVVIEALNRDGEKIMIEADDFMASVFCHEIDHLDGKLFLDEAENIQIITSDQMEKRRSDRKTRRRARIKK